MAVGVPCAVFAEGEGACSYGLGRVPVEVPEGRGVAAREVEGCDLQVAPVEVVLVEGDYSVDGYFFHVAPPHVVVAVFDDGVAVLAGEADGAVVGVVVDGPFPRLCLEGGLIAVGVVGGEEGFRRILPDGGVLVEVVGVVRGFEVFFLRGFAVAYVVISISVLVGSQGRAGEFASSVVGEGVLPGGCLPGAGAGGGAAECIVGVASKDDSGGAPRGVDGGGEVALRFVAAGEEEAVGVREGVEEVAAREVAVGKCFFFRALEE